jgi:hypothetical protein
MKLISASSPAWVNENQSVIDLVANFEGIGEVPFTASSTDREAHGRDIFARAAAGEFGPVAAYVAPPPAPPAPPRIPQTVSRFQARAALHLAGLLPQVEALMADEATPVLARLAWAEGIEVRRTSPTVLAMAQALGLDEAALDALFTQAAQIEA